MKILIPMAGAGQRFVQAGYQMSKPLLPVQYRKNGENCPMVICAVKDLPGIHANGDNLAFIMRTSLKKEGVSRVIRQWYPGAEFFSIDELTQGQACTCLLAEPFIDRADELMIAACDNGIEYDLAAFEQLRTDCDVIVFTYRNDLRVYDNPDAFGWVITQGNKVKGISVKKHISLEPEKDHAVVGTFWFRKGSIFLEAAKKMIDENDRIHNEFYVDEVIKHVLELGYCAKVFEVNRFLNYGTPEDYENYHKTIIHFREFLQSEYYLGEG